MHRLPDKELGLPKAKKTRSPLTGKPLRLPGQSLADEISDIAYDGVLTPLLLAAFMVVIAALEWWRFYMNLKPSPWIYTIMAALVAAYAAARVTLTVRNLRDLKLGRDGERAVAQYLEWFRTAGFFVFHDVPTETANIDHVLIGARGIYTIETKTLSKPHRGECKIRVSEGKIAANGIEMSRNPLIQSKAQARWLANFLGESRFKVSAQPVVVFPGWFVEPFDMRREGVWVMEPKALDRFLQNEPERFAPEQVKAMASALSSYVRSKAEL